MIKKKSKVVIIGRKNVGKSSIFNKIIGFNKSIIDIKNNNIKDNIYIDCEYKNKKFTLIDTNGIKIYKKINNKLDKNIQLQIEIIINESDIILFVVDVLDGITKEDKIIAKKLYLLKKKCIIVLVNKVDTIKDIVDFYNFYSLGFKNVFYISTINNIGINFFLNFIVKKLNNFNYINLIDFKFSIIGKLNVGKSSLINSLLKKNRVLVSEKPGTTMSNIEIKIDNFLNKKTCICFDTIGYKKYNKIIYLNLINIIKNTDIIIIIIDINIGICKKDLYILNYVKKYYKSIIIIFNKIDIFLKKYSLKEIKKIKNEILNKFKFLYYIPILFISILKNFNINKIFKILNIINENRKKKISTFFLNNIVCKELNFFLKKRNKIYYIVQDFKSFIPTFILFIKSFKNLRFSDFIFFEKKIRFICKFYGVYIKIIFKKKKK